MEDVFPIIEFLKHRRLQVVSRSNETSHHRWCLKHVDDASTTLLFEFPRKTKIPKVMAIQVMQMLQHLQELDNPGTINLIFLTQVISRQAVGIFEQHFLPVATYRQVIQHDDIMLGVNNVQIPTYHVLSEEEKKTLDWTKLPSRLTTDSMSIYFGWPVGTVTYSIDTDDYRTVVEPTPELRTKVKKVKRRGGKIQNLLF